MRFTSIVLACMLLVLSTSMQAQSYKSLVETAIEALGKDSLTQAEDAFRKAIALDPSLTSNVILHRYLGEIYLHQQRYAEAAEAYTRGLDLSPSEPDLLLGRASAYMQADKTQHALADYDEVLSHVPDHRDARFFRAYLLTQSHRYKEARTDYEWLVRNDPDNEDARLGLVLLNHKDRRPHQAMEQLNELIIRFPTHARHLLVRSDFYLESRAYEKALADVNKAIALEPDNPDCYLSRATIYSVTKKRKLMRQDCQTAIRLGARADHVAALLQKR